MINSTLCYLERGDAYLMLHRVKKKGDLNHDKWIGVGGKFEDGESPEDCILRETWEETGLTLMDYRYRGLVTFVSDEAPTEYMHLFTATGWTGTPHPCDEGELAWIKKAELRGLPMWEGDKIFLRLLEENVPFFSLKLQYQGDRLDRAVLKWTNIAAPCTEAGAADRLEHLLDCQRGLPFSTVFALREGTAFRGLAGCPPVDTAAGIYGLFYQLLPACWGRGLGLAAAAEALRRLERLAPALVLADTVAENTASVRILERLGFVRTAVHHRAFCREGRMLDIWDYARRWAGPAETV